MFTLLTDCNKCIHEKICKYKDNAKNAMNRLKEMQYGEGPNDDYDWDTIMQTQHVTISFSCPNFSSKTFTRGIEEDHDFGFDIED